MVIDWRKDSILLLVHHATLLLFCLAFPYAKVGGLRYSGFMDPASLELLNRTFIHNPVFSFFIGVSAIIGTLIYIFGFSHVIKRQFKRRHMEYKIKHLANHYIICGFGRVGQQVAKELSAEEVPFVVIDKDEELMKVARDHNWPHIHGDVALDESLLKTAGIDKAKCIIIAVGQDADAVFMAVSARAMNHDIFIVARASSQEAADKLSKIGVNRIALPYQIGGYHMATMALRPAVVDFLNVLVDNNQEELEIEEFYIAQGGPYDGKALEEAGIFKKNLAVVAVRHKNGKTQINPPESLKMVGDDRLIVIGGKEQLASLDKEFDKNQPKKDEEKIEPKKAKVENVPIMDGVKPSPFMNQE